MEIKEHDACKKSTNVKLPLSETTNVNSAKFCIKYIKAPFDVSAATEDSIISSAATAESKDPKASCDQSVQTEISAQYLPKDILLKIFKFLPLSSLIKCTQVCQNWTKVM